LYGVTIVAAVIYFASRQRGVDERYQQSQRGEERSLAVLSSTDLISSGVMTLGFFSVHTGDYFAGAEIVMTSKSRACTIISFSLSYLERRYLLNLEVLDLALVEVLRFVEG
jgi:hypothetical protein